MPGTVFLTVEQIQALEASVEAELLRRARDQKIEKPIVRDLLASDINSVSGHVWVEHCSAGSYNTVFSGILKTPHRLIAIYGAKDAYDVNTSAAKDGGAIAPGKTIRFGLGEGPAAIKDVWNIEKIRGNSMGVFAKEPIIYNKGEKYTIQIRGENAGVDHIVLYGKLCEALGETITG